jgi:hypothetical protein
MKIGPPKKGVLPKIPPASARRAVEWRETISSIHCHPRYWQCESRSSLNKVNDITAALNENTMATITGQPGKMTSVNDLQFFAGNRKFNSEQS